MAPELNDRAGAASAGARLCLACGMCCDGTLFKDVELQPGDSAAKSALQQLSLYDPGINPGDNLRQSQPRGTKWPQPCAALCADLRCRIYAERPGRCRDFECSQFKAVAAGERDEAEALRIIRRTRQAADKVRRLLRALGDEHERLPLSRRFGRMQRRYEAGRFSALDESALERYSELTLAVHQLQMLLQREFYPGS